MSKARSDQVKIIAGRAYLLDKRTNLRILEGILCGYWRRWGTFWLCQFYFWTRARHCPAFHMCSARRAMFGRNCSWILHRWRCKPPRNCVLSLVHAPARSFPDWSLPGTCSPYSTRDRLMSAEKLNESMNYYQTAYANIYVFARAEGEKGKLHI